MTSVLLDPYLAFPRLEAELAAEGWRQVDRSDADLVPGEPAHARFERATEAGGGSTLVQYSFNPVCRLRVLEFDEDEVRLPDEIPTAGPVEVAIWLESTEDRDVLRGLLAAALLREPDLAPRVARHTNHGTPAVAAAATRAMGLLPARPSGGQPTGDRGPEEARARANAEVAIDVLVEQLRPLLRALGRDPDGRLAGQLRPRPQDYPAVFVDSAVSGARVAYEEAWARGPRVRSVGTDWTLTIRVAPAGMLASENELSHHFPGGYRGIAHLLTPSRVWVRWSYRRPGADAGQSYDGLVWIGDHWSWFPKPYRVLRSLAHPSAS